MLEIAGINSGQSCESEGVYMAGCDEGSRCGQGDSLDDGDFVTKIGEERPVRGKLKQGGVEYGDPRRGGQ